MNILVIEDSAINQQSARQTLTGHQPTIATSYREGLEALLLPSVGSSLLTGEGGATFDVVMSDLIMPASEMMLTPEAKQLYAGVKMPLGWSLVLRAVLNGTRYAALVSDTNHHHHPGAFALDIVDCADDSWGDNPHIQGLPRKKAQFNINGAKVGFFQAPLCLVKGTSDCNWKCTNGKDAQNQDCEWCNGTGFAKGKDWGRVLQCLLED